MKIHTKLICLCLLLLSSCYITDSGLPGIDWNKNHIDKTIGYKKTMMCYEKQKSIAQEKKGSSYNEDIDFHIFVNCSSMDGKYKFIDDSEPKYRSP